MDSVVQKYCVKCFARSNLTHFANHDSIKKVSSYKGNVFVVAEHLGDLCGSLKCLLACITEKLNAVCKLSGWVVLDALMQPLEAVSLMADGMNSVLKDIVFNKMDTRCHFVLNSAVQKKARKGDLGVFEQ